MLKKGAVVLHKQCQASYQSQALYWSLALISELIHSPDDGKVRTVKIRKSDGTEVVASIANLYPLELDTVFEHKSVENITDRQPPEHGRPEVESSRPAFITERDVSDSEEDHSSAEDVPVPSDLSTNKDSHQRPRKRAA